ncbi:MAG: tyrosine-type recombinase/integrase [Nitrosarchaeum sp.]|nr:tyrosine-type recombinase/integrase [Nitrosarchaeum sp.]
MSSFLLKKKSKKSFLEGIQILEYSTRENYRSALKQFETFCNFYYNKTIQYIIDEIKSLKQEQKDEAFLGMLQEFVNWMKKTTLANTTIQKYFQIIIYYFSYHGIRAHPIDLRQNIKLPKKFKEKLHSLTKEEIIQLFKFTPQSRQMLYLVLIGSGMRIRETVALRKKDFDLDYPKRIKIEIPAQFTKTKTAHTTYVSKEAESLLKPHLESIKNNDLVFATNSIPYHASMTEIGAFARYREKAGLTRIYESTKRHHISLHSFRSYFFIRARRIHDTDIAHAMIGHSTYLDMYDRKEDDEKLDLFLEVENELKICG